MREVDDLGAVGLGVLSDVLRLAAGARQNVVGVGLGLVARALLVGPRALDVVEGVDHRERRLDALELNLRDLHARLLVVEQFLQEIARLVGDLLASVGHGGLDRGAADDVAQRALAVRTAGEGALRDVISRTPIQAAMSNRRQQIADQTRDLLQKRSTTSRRAWRSREIQLQRVEPPLAVIDAFNDVQRARADQERARNKAEAYANDILPRARGEAEHIRQDAEVYRTQVVNLAHGEPTRSCRCSGATSRRRT